MFPAFSYRVLFQRFFPQNISLLPKIVTEAHAKLKKRKTSCNTTLKHKCSHGQVHPFGTCKSNFQSDLLAGSIFFSIYSSSIYHLSSHGLWCITA